MEERHWYLQAVKQFEWTKAELLRAIASEAHLELTLDESEVLCYTENEQNEMERIEHDQDTLPLSRHHVMTLSPCAELWRIMGLFCGNACPFFKIPTTV